MKIDRLLAAALLLGAAVLHVLAAAERWWPACVPGAYERGPCLRVQDSRYDFSPPRVPWEPVGNAAVLQGAAWALLAMAVVLLPSALVGLRSRWWRAAFAAVAVGLLIQASFTAASGFADHVVAVPGAALLLTVLWNFGWPILLIVLLVRTGSDREVPGRRLSLLALGSLLIATPLLQVFLAPVLTGYLSYDRSPWTEAAPAPFLALAGLLVPFLRRRTGSDPASQTGE